jgi:hypothetical protein
VTTGLREWLAHNRTAPKSWRSLAQRLVGTTDDLATFTAVRLAFDAAQAEVRRMTSTEEGQALNHVGKKIDELREAIELAPLSRRRAYMLGLTGEGRQDEQLAVSWHDDGDIAPRAYSVSVLGMLGVAQHLLDQHRAMLLPRAVQRHRDRPLSAAFVHWLVHYARVHDVQLGHDRIAELANAALALSDAPLMAADVRAILKPKLSSPKRAR